MKHRNSPTIAIAAGFLFAAALSLATARTLRADNAARSQTINLNAGQTQVIDHLKIDSRPSIRVIENPHALVIHGETPGQLVLLGAERGQWEVTVTRDDGAQVAYRVEVAAIADRATPLDAGTGPVASADVTLPTRGATSADVSGPSETVRSARAVDSFSVDLAPQTNLPMGDNRLAAKPPIKSQSATAQEAAPPWPKRKPKRKPGSCRSAT